MEIPQRTPDPAELVLTVPAEAPYVGMARLFAASAARTFGIDEEVIEDIKLAISEATTSVVMTASSGVISIAATRTDVGLTYEVRHDGGVGSSVSQEPPSADGFDTETARDLGLRIIRALFPTPLEDEGDVDPSTLRFSVDVPA